MTHRRHRRHERDDGERRDHAEAPRVGLLQAHRREHPRDRADQHGIARQLSSRAGDRFAGIGWRAVDDAVLLDGIRFLGGTLWTDFRLGSLSLTHAFHSAQGRDGMVDYRRIRTLLGDLEKVRSHPLIGERAEVGGFIYDVDTGLLNEV